MWKKKNIQMQLLASHFPYPSFLTLSEEWVSFSTTPTRTSLGGCYGKSDNSFLESSDKDVHPRKESNKCSETEPTNISEVTEKSAPQHQFNCDQCIFQWASYKDVMHHTRIKQKINQMDGKSDCNVDESNSAKTLRPDDSKSENFMKKKSIKCEDCEYTTKEEL